MSPEAKRSLDAQSLAEARAVFGGARPALEPKTLMVLGLLLWLRDDGEAIRFSLRAEATDLLGCAWPVALKKRQA